MATNSNFVTDNFALTALNQIGKHLREVYQNGKNREARLGMMGASFLAGMAFGGSASDVCMRWHIRLPLCLDIRMAMLKG